MKQRQKITLGGMLVALSMVCMMLTGLLPMADYALPAAAGILLIAAVVELGHRWAALCYLAVALLSFFLAPLKDSALFYATFLGWYPIWKSVVEGWQKSIPLEWVIKLLTFNLAVGAGLAAAIWLFQLEAYADLISAAPLVVAGGAAALNLVFVIYDMAVSRLAYSYIHWFRPRYLQKIWK